MADYKVHIICFSSAMCLRQQNYLMNKTYVEENNTVFVSSRNVLCKTCIEAFEEEIGGEIIETNFLQW